MDGDVDMAFGSKRPASGTVGGDVDGKKDAKAQVLGFLFYFIFIFFANTEDVLIWRFNGLG